MWLYFKVPPTKKNYNLNIKDHWPQITIIYIILKDLKYCWNYQKWQRQEVRKCYWKKWHLRLTWYRVVTNLQFVKNALTYETQKAKCNKRRPAHKSLKIWRELTRFSLSWLSWHLTVSEEPLTQRHCMSSCQGYFTSTEKKRLVCGLLSLFYVQSFSLLTPFPLKMCLSPSFPQALLASFSSYVIFRKSSLETDTKFAKTAQHCPHLQCSTEARARRWCQTGWERPYRRSHRPPEPGDDARWDGNTHSDGHTGL